MFSTKIQCSVRFFFYFLFFNLFFFFLFSFCFAFIAFVFFLAASGNYQNKWKYKTENCGEDVIVIRHRYGMIEEEGEAGWEAGERERDRGPETRSCTFLAWKYGSREECRIWFGVRRWWWVLVCVLAVVVSVKDECWLLL